MTVTNNPPHPRLADLEKHIAAHEGLTRDLEDMIAKEDKSPYLQRLVENAHAYSRRLKDERKRLINPDAKRKALTTNVVSSLHLSLRHYLPKEFSPAMLLAAAERVVTVVLGGPRAKIATKGGEGKRAKRHPVKIKAVQLDQFRIKSGKKESAKACFEAIKQELFAFARKNDHPMLSAKVLIAEISKARKKAKKPSA
jgi:hypothetical protein